MEQYWCQTGTQTVENQLQGKATTDVISTSSPGLRWSLDYDICGKDGAFQTEVPFNFSKGTSSVASQRGGKRPCIGHRWTGSIELVHSVFCEAIYCHQGGVRFRPESFTPAAPGSCVVALPFSFGLLCHQRQPLSQQCKATQTLLLLGSLTINYCEW